MKPLLKDLNEHITCSLCFGYLIDATTVIECLCTFCKSCIVKHLEDSNTCPKCSEVIHHSHPKDHIRFDRTLQSIVYKVVPDLQARVEQLQKEYESTHPETNNIEPELMSDEEECNGVDTNGNSNRPVRSPVRLHNYRDYIVPVKVDVHRATMNGNCSDTEMEDTTVRSNDGLHDLEKPVLGCPARCPIRVIKKFVQTKLNVEDEYELDILCNDEILGKDHTLEFIKMTRWRTKDLPLILTYRIRPDI